MTTQDDEAMAAADKEMEERAYRVKHLLSQRYQGLKNDQVCRLGVYLHVIRVGVGVGVGVGGIESTKLLNDFFQLIQSFFSSQVVFPCFMLPPTFSRLIID